MVIIVCVNVVSGLSNINNVVNRPLMVKKKMRMLVVAVATMMMPVVNLQFCCILDLIHPSHVWYSSFPLVVFIHNTNSAPQRRMFVISCYPLDGSTCKGHSHKIIKLTAYSLFPVMIHNMKMYIQPIFQCRNKNNISFL